MDLKPFEKLIITQMNVRTNARIIGIKTELNGSTTYMAEELRKDFLPHVMGSRLIRITAMDIENKTVNIERHAV